ncbi:MAG: hypothetical protein WBA89_12230, partial [Microcoleus sp.]
AIASTELIPKVVIAKPVWATVLALFLGGAFFVWVNQLLNLSKKGFVTNAAFKSPNMPRTLRFLLLAVFIIPVWLGTTLGYWGLRGQAELPKLVVLAFTTGTLMVAIAEEIIPEVHQTQDTNWSILTFIGSFALSILFSSYLE